MEVVDIIIFAIAVMLAAYGIYYALRGSQLFPWLSTPVVSKASELASIDELIEAEKVRQTVVARQQVLNDMREK